MKTKRTLIFLLCIVMLVSALAVIVSAEGETTATDSTHYKETVNEDGSVTIEGFGTIPVTEEGYVDATKYPFVVFHYTNGKVSSVRGRRTLGTAIDAAKSHQSNNKWDASTGTYTGTLRTSVIVMRNNYTTVIGKINTGAENAINNPGGDQYDNYAQLKGEVILDLNGYELTQGAGTSGLFYQVTNKAWGNPNNGGYGVFETEYTVVNGTIKVNDNPVFYGNMWNPIYYDANGNNVSTVYDSTGAKIEGTQIMQNDKGGYYFVDSSGNAITTIYNDKGEVVPVGENGLELSTVVSMADKDFIWNFDNINFEYVEGATETSMLMGYTGIQTPKNNPATAAAPYYFNFTNCAFDLTNAPEGKDVTLFKAHADYEDRWLRLVVNVAGCEIKASSTTAINYLNLYQLQTWHDSSVTFTTDENGNFLTLVLPEGDTLPTPPNNDYVFIDGNAYYWHNVSGKYVLSRCTAVGKTHAVCTCGTKSDCEDTDENNVCDVCAAEKIGGVWVAGDNNDVYPFVVLDNNENYVGLYTSWVKATDAVKKNTGYTVILRRDYRIGESGDSVNLQTAKGNFTVDLNGYSITRPFTGAYLFDNWCDGSTVANSVKVTIKNGTLNAEKWLICLSGSSAMKNEKTINFQFDNVTFKYIYNEEYNSKDGWIVAVHGQTYNKKLTSNMVFNGCTFDSTEMSETLLNGGTPMFNLDVNNKYGIDYVNVNLTFNGGKIVANVLSEQNFYQIHSNDTVTYGEYNGEYIKLEMPTGKSPATHADPDYFTINETSAFFHTSEVVGEKTVYTLSNCTAVSGTHNCSCGVVVTSCYDGNDAGHDCDVCGEPIDENNDHICDICKTDKVTDCIDSDRNHDCDICGTILVADCTDTNNDEKCDYCGFVVNAYGIKGIPSTYASVETYPFFVLKLQDGVYTFEYAAKTFYGAHAGTSAIGRAIYNVLRDNNAYDLENGVYVPQGTASTSVPTDIATAIIVMRRDYSIVSSNSAEYYNNIAHAQGEVIIDFGGHTLTEAANSGKSIFYVTAKGWPDSSDGVYTFPSTYTFKNGNIKVRNYAFATVSTHDTIEENKGWNFYNSAINLNFENVTFGLADGATTKTLAYSNGTFTDRYDGVGNVNVSFNGCTFDLLTNAPNAMYPITIVNNITTETVGPDVDCDVVIENCTVLASDMSLITVHATGDWNGTTTTVAKNAITLKMPAGSATPLATNTVTLTNGAEYAFKKSSTADGYDVYTLTPAVTIGFKTTNSVTLDTNFIYNVYVPVANVVGITVNDNKVDLVEVTRNGAQYYHVAINLASSESLYDIILRVTLDSGNGNLVTLKSTLGVAKYAKTVINGNYSASTKTLMKDMLVYATAAHTYFGNTADVAANMTTANSLINGYFRDLPMGEAKKPSNNTYFKNVAVYVGEIPSFRFYLANDYEDKANIFSFKVGGNAITAKEGTDANGKYLEVVMRAYMMLDDVTYTVENTSVETYNLYSYYDYIRKSGNANLLAVVKGLMKYAASANDYYNVVANKEYGKMVLNVPESIRANDEGQNVSVMFSNPDYYGAVTYTTNNPNVYIENGKIYAKGAFDKDTYVTVTARTDHHVATATVRVCQTYFIDNFEGNDPNTIEGGKYITDSQGNNLTTNYVVKGVIKITDFNKDGVAANNEKPYVQFHFARKTRLLLWDNDRDSVLGMGYEHIVDAATMGSEHCDETKTGLEKYCYDAETGALTLEWAIVAQGNKAYIYINGEYQCYIDIPENSSFSYLNIGANLMDVWVCVTDVCTAAENEAAYNALVAEYPSIA